MSTGETDRSTGRDLARRLAGWSLIIAPALLLLWNAIDPATSDQAPLRLAQIGENEARFVLAGYLGVLGVWAFVPGIVGLWQLFRGPRLTLGQAGAGLMLIGLITTITFFGFGVYEYEAAQPGYDRAQMAKLADAVEAPSNVVIPLLVVFLVGVVIGSLIVAWSLWRRRIVPWWSPAAIVVGVVVNFVADTATLSAVGSAFTLVGFGWVGVTLLRMSAEAWELGGREPAAAPAG